jgi:hypothetical protein
MSTARAPGLRACRRPLFDDHTGRGAVPLRRAGVLRGLNRSTAAASQTILAAVRAPRPGMASSAGASFWVRSVISTLNALMVTASSTHLWVSWRASLATRPGWSDSRCQPRRECVWASRLRAVGSQPGSSSWRCQRSRQWHGVNRPDRDTQAVDGGPGGVSFSDGRWPVRSRSCATAPILRWPERAEWRNRLKASRASTRSRAIR